MLHQIAEEADDDRVIFVTRNLNDFADPKDPTRLHEDLYEELSEPENVELLGDLAAVYERLGILREDLRQVVERAVTSDAGTLAFQTTGYVDVPLPGGVDGEIVGAGILDFEVGDVFYAWGAASGTLVADIEFVFSGIVEEHDFEEMGSARLDVQVDEWNEDSHFVAVSGEAGARVEVTFALDPDAETLELLNAELLDGEGSLTAALR